MNINYLAQLGHFIPELLLVLTMMGQLCLEVTYRRSEKKHHFVFYTSVIGLVVCLFSEMARMGHPASAIFTNSLIIDHFSSFMKILLLLGGLGVFFLGHVSKDLYEGLKSEFYILVVGVIIGGMLLTSANNLLTFYLGIETLSILSYVLAGMKKFNSRSSEAGLKYAIYGGVSAGIMLFGISHIYGVLGTIQFNEIAAKIGFVDSSRMTVLVPAFLCFFVGIGFKLSLVPFHMWTPDVYEGSPLPVTMFFSIVPKLAAVAGLTRVSMTFFAESGPMQDMWIWLLHVVAALTMFIGNISAINQRSVKRMLAYSSIAHAGTMMLGVIVLDDLGTNSLLFYALAYLFMTLVAFYITSFVSDKYGNDHFERFNGLVYRYPIMAIAMAMVMFSLAGLPPFSGFVAKFNIISATIAKGYYGISFIAVINSVISLYYYMKIVRLMVLKDSESNEIIEGFKFSNQLVVTVCLLPVLILGLFWNQFIVWTQGAHLFVN